MHPLSYGLSALMQEQSPIVLCIRRPRKRHEEPTVAFIFLFQKLAVLHEAHEQAISDGIANTSVIATTMPMAFAGVRAANCLQSGL